jgi:uncharacterized protein YpiB (UPF0302 family)
MYSCLKNEVKKRGNFRMTAVMSLEKNEYITINDVKYTISDNNGKTTIMRFNSKQKMWVRLSFSEESAPNSIIDVLSRQYIARATEASF